MDILYINYIYQRGHINYDQIHINALMQQASNVKLILHENIAKELPYSKSQYALQIPSILSFHTSSGLINRFFFIVILLYIKYKISFSNYDKVILSNMDEITLGLIPLCKNMYITCHNNVRNIESGIKGYFLKKLSKNNSFIVFNSYMAQPFIERNIKVYIISHGCIKPFNNELRMEVPISDIRSFKMILFHPSIRPNEDFIAELKCDRKFQRFLEENEILIILRALTPQENITRNIIYINNYLTKAEYRNLFMKSDIILLAYPNSFSYRVSGVSFECVANNKRLLILENPSLNYCNDFYNYYPMFRNLKQLEERILFLKEHEDALCIANSESIKPNYNKLLSS